MAVAFDVHDVLVDRCLLQLRAALDGRGPAVLPVDGPTADPLISAATLDRPVHPDTALLVPTSGSTGTPKVVELSAEGLLASAQATHARIGRPGRWLLALPLTHIAGWQVLVRSTLVSDTDSAVPVTLDSRKPFTAGAFRDTLLANPDVRYCSLIPTQLHRVLADRDAIAAARSLTILLGGAAAPVALLHRAERAGLRVVTTYGSTETSGGCLYDGQPLDGVHVRTVPDGRLAIGGPMVALGYRTRSDRSAHADDTKLRTDFETDGDGTRWFTTSDLAELEPDGRVRILGRVDDVIVTGGEKVHPAEVERVLALLPGSPDVLVVGVPDEEWGQRVVALTTSEDVDLAAWREHVRRHLPGYAAPRAVLRVPRLPQLGIGKPDRRAAAELAVAIETGTARQATS